VDQVKSLIVAASAVAIGLGGNSARARAATQFDWETTSRLQILQPIIHEAADRFGIPEAWIRAVIAAESGARTTVDGQPITSPAGAIGPMQVMPRTYEELRLRYGLGPDSGDPEQNILAGTAYLKELYERFGRDGMFAAYHAGPARYQAYLEGKRYLSDETRAYLAALGNVASGTPPELSLPSGTGLFFPLSGENSEGRMTQTAPGSDGLFVPLNSQSSAIPVK
jgi:soluble lytic murein transglycosylase-like protein